MRGKHWLGAAVLGILLVAGVAPPAQAVFVTIDLGITFTPPPGSPFAAGSLSGIVEFAQFIPAGNLIRVPVGDFLISDLEPGARFPRRLSLLTSSAA